MSINFAILGYLSWEPMTGYDLKKLFADSATFYWSGNNNQIYRALVKLHQDGLVSQDVEMQESAPPRKVYSITAAGQAALREWVQQTPELPQIRHAFLMQLAWADQLEQAELDRLIADYEEEVRVKLLMVGEDGRRGNGRPHRTPRETLIWQHINRNWQSYYEHELAWIQELRQALADTE